MDADGDGYGDPATALCLCAPAAPNDVADGSDCFDSNDQAHPGQTDTYDVDRGDGNFDYDCNGTEDRLYMDEFDCQNGQCYIITPGWMNGVAACGVTDDWGTDCYGGGGCTDVTEPRTQECR